MIAEDARVFTPDDIMEGRLPPKGPVAVYDDDQIYLAGVIAEKLARDGHEVIFVTPAAVVSPFTQLTLEQERVQLRLIELGVRIMCHRTLVSQTGDHLRVADTYSGRGQDIDIGASVLVTERTRQTNLYDVLKDSAGPPVTLIGDAASPALIADAVFSGHMAARNFDRAPQDIDAEWYRREFIALGDT